MPFRLARTLRAHFAAAVRNLTSRSRDGGFSDCAAESLEDRRLLTVSIVTPYQYDVEGYTAAFFADFTADARPEEASVNWGDGTVEPLQDRMMDFGTSAGRIYGIHSYLSPGDRTVTFTLKQGGSADAKTFFASIGGDFSPSAVSSNVSGGEALAADGSVDSPVATDSNSLDSGSADSGSIQPAGAGDAGGLVNALDLSFVRQRLNRSATNPGTTGATYSPFADVTFDGSMNSLDLSAVKQRLNLRSPAGEPTLPAGGAAAAGIGPSSANVTQVFVNGPGLTTATTNANTLAFRTMAGIDSTYGYAVPAGANQLKPIPWIGGVNSVAIRFTNDVNAQLQQGDLAIRGVSTPTYVPTAFSYDPATKTGVWTFATVTNDKLRFHLDDALVSGLDGEWANGADTFPSGNGTPGGDFDFRVNELAGDATQGGSAPPSVDLDIDSDNSGRFDVPDRSSAEDSVEQQRAGKLLVVNRDDTDDDGILDFADGFDAFSDTEDDAATGGEEFVPVVLDVSGVADPGASVVFDYDGADPFAPTVSRTAVETGGLDGVTYTTHNYSVGTGLLRLWLSAGDAARKDKYLMPGHAYTLSELGLYRGGTLPLFLEAVNGSATKVEIVVTLRLNDVVCDSDTIRVLPLDPLIGMQEPEVTGYNVVRNTTGSLSLEGTSGKDIILGTEAAEIINGNGGDDIILAGQNTYEPTSTANDPNATAGDEINGGAGSDLIFSWFGNNRIVTDSADEFSMAEGYGFNGFFGPPPAMAPPGVAAAAPAQRDGQVFISKQVEAAYKQMYGANDIWLKGFKELGGRVLAVQQDGKWFSNWTINWKQRDGAFTSYVGYDVKIEHDIGGVMVAAATLREAIMSIAYEDNVRWGDFFQAQNMQEIADGAVYGEALEAWTQLRLRNFEHAKQVAAIAAELYANGMTLAYGAAGDVADLIISIPDVLKGNPWALLALLPLIPRVAPLAGRARAMVDWGFGKFVMTGEKGDVLLREASELGFVLRNDLIKATGEVIPPKVKRVNTPNGKGTWVVGDAQKIYSDGAVTLHGVAHAAAIERKADELAATGAYSHITMNRGVNTATGRATESATRPDIIAVRWDGKVEMYEYLSSSQTPEQLRAQMDTAMKTLDPKYRTEVMEVLQVPS